jgi:hypothetical protein
MFKGSSNHTKMRSTKVSLEYVAETYVSEDDMVATPSAYEILQLIADEYIWGGEKATKRYFSVVEVSVFENEYHLTLAGELHMADVVAKYCEDNDGLSSSGHTYKRSQAKNALMTKTVYRNFL